MDTERNDLLCLSQVTIGDFEADLEQEFVRTRMRNDFQVKKTYLY